MENKWDVSRIDFQFRELLEKTTGARVHSVFKNAVNVLPDGERRLLTICTSAYNQPGTAVVKNIPEGIVAGQKVAFKWPEIIIEDIIFDARRTKVWREPYPEPAAKPEIADFGKRKTAAFHKIFGLRSNRPAESFAGKSIIEIVGIGEGLTPAGDDYLLGALNTAHYEKKMFPCEKHDDVWKRLLHAVGGCESRTNDISASFFAYALNGRISERAMNLLNLIYAGADEAEISSAAEIFFQWGATSGKYHLAGLLDFQGNI